MEGGEVENEDNRFKNPFYGNCPEIFQLAVFKNDWNHHSLMTPYYINWETTVRKLLGFIC